MSFYCQNEKKLEQQFFYGFGGGGVGPPELPPVFCIGFVTCLACACWLSVMLLQLMKNTANKTAIISFFIGFLYVVFVWNPEEIRNISFFLILVGDADPGAHFPAAALSDCRFKAVLRHILTSDQVHIRTKTFFNHNDIGKTVTRNT